MPQFYITMLSIDEVIKILPKNDQKIVTQLKISEQFSRV